jgi:tetratricopeptide (TPR) repeat protein
VTVRTRVPQSSRPAGSPVKGWQRHVEGWQAGIVAVAIAGTITFFVVPRAVPPSEVPEPVVRGAGLEAALLTDEEQAGRWARRWADKEIDHDVLLLSEAVGAFNRAEIEGSDADLEAAHREVVEAGRKAIARSPDDVLALRSHQTLAFLREMKAFSHTGEPSGDLLDLGGTFASTAEAFRWYDRPARQLAHDDAAWRAMYKKRWNEITGLNGSAFALARDEDLALYRFLIAHPAVAHRPLPEGAGPDAERARALADGVAENEKRLQKIRELAKIDPEYPAAFAEGVVQFQLGRFELAAVAFERHLDAHPDGPWTLRAKNHLKAALEAR